MSGAASEEGEKEWPAKPHHPAGGFVDSIGFDRGRYGNGASCLELTVQQRHLRTLDLAHGGVIATMLDCVIGMAVGSKLRPNFYCVTMQLSVNYIRPAWNGEKLIGTGKVLHAGAQTLVGTGEIRTAKGALVASGSGTFMQIAYPDEKRERLVRRED